MGFCHVDWGTSGEGCSSESANQTTTMLGHGYSIRVVSIAATMITSTVFAPVQISTHRMHGMPVNFGCEAD